MHKLKEVARRPLGFVLQPSQVTQTMSGCPISVGPQATQDIWCYTSSSRHRFSGSPSLCSQLGDSSSALLSTSVALGLTPCASGAQADELTTPSWPVLPGG